MERIPETECMDCPEEAREYAAMDNSEPNRAFVETLEIFGMREGELLDLGTGPADIPILLAERFPEVRITAIDMSLEMLKIARLRIAEAGLSQRVRLMPGDAKSLPFADGLFEGVFSNTILHHVADPFAFLREAARVCSRNGKILIRDLMRPADEEELDRLVGLHAVGATGKQRKLLADSLRAAYTPAELARIAEEAGLAGARIEKSSDRHLTLYWVHP